MKTIKRLLMAIVLLTGVIICLVSCDKDNTQVQAVSLVLDETEEHFRHFDTEDLKRHFLITKNPNAGIRLRVTVITEFSSPEVWELGLPAVKIGLLGNDYTRKKEIKAFYTQLDSVLTEIRQQRKKRVGSAVYEVLVRELQYLSKAEADQKILIVNSDLMQNSIMSFYTKSTMRDVVQAPQKVIDHLAGYEEIPTVKGMDKIMLIYQPQDTVEDNRFRAVTRLYEEIFQHLDVNDITIGSGLTNE